MQDYLFLGIKGYKAATNLFETMAVLSMFSIIFPVLASFATLYICRRVPALSKTTAILLDISSD